MISAHAQNQIFLSFLRKVAAGNVQGCQEMISAGINVNGSRVLTISDPALHLCAISDSPQSDEIMGMLIAAGASLDERDAGGLTALQKAARHGNEQACKRLILAGADVMAHKKEQNTPLNFAVDSGNTRICEWLIDAGAHIEHQDSEHWTALMHAVQNNDTAMVKLLIQKGADVHAPVSGDPDALLHNAMETAIMSNALECAKVLVDAGYDVKREVNSKTLLHCAASCGSVEFIDWLVGRGIDLNEKDKESKTPLHLAASYGGAEACKHLLAAGADPFVLDWFGSNALHLAAIQGQSDTCIHLMSIGLPADLKHESKNMDAMEMAISRGKEKCAQNMLAYMQSKAALKEMDRLLDASVRPNLASPQ